MTVRTFDEDIVERVRDLLVAAGSPPDPPHVAEALRRAGVVADDERMRWLVDRVRRDLVGAGVLEPLLRQPGVTDVLVNAPGEVWVDRGLGLQPSDVRFPDERAVRTLAQRLASSAGRRLDDASPYVDARLADGVRLHAVLPPVSPAGTLISLRVPRRTPFRLDELVAAGTLAPGIEATLREIVRARVALLVTGGTGSGKTTLLAALLGLVDPAERIVLVEDSAELQPEHRHVVRLEARPANVEGQGAVTLRDLVRQALRMRPDRLVVGEVRGAEVVDLLAALNTGHDGGAATLHVNDVRDVPARVEALALAAGLGRAAVHSQLAAGLRTVVHLRRSRAGLREVAAVGWLRARPDGLVETSPAVGLCPHGAVTEGPAAAALATRLTGRPWAEVRLCTCGLAGEPYGDPCTGDPPGRPDDLLSANRWRGDRAG